MRLEMGGEIEEGINILFVCKLGYRTNELLGF